MTGQRSYDGIILNLRFLRDSAYDPEITDRVFRILVIIASHADKNGYCFPAVSSMAKKLGVTRPAVQRPIRILVQKGHLNVGRQIGRSNNYRVHYKRYSKMRGNTIKLQVMQPNAAAPPATTFGCIKKPLQETKINNKDAIDGLQTRKRHFYEEKIRERQTGITKQAEENLFTVRAFALEGLSAMQRMSEIRKIDTTIEAMPGSLLDKHNAMQAEYESLAVRRGRYKPEQG